MIALEGPQPQILGLSRADDSPGPPRPAGLETRVLDALRVDQSPVLAISFRPYLGFRPGSAPAHLDRWGLRPQGEPAEETRGTGTGALFRSPTLGQRHRRDPERQQIQGQVRVTVNPNAC